MAATTVGSAEEERGSGRARCGRLDLWVLAGKRRPLPAVGHSKIKKRQYHYTEKRSRVTFLFVDINIQE